MRVPPRAREYAVPLVERQVLALCDKTVSFGAKMTPVDPLYEHNDQTITRPIRAVGATGAHRRPLTPSAAHRARWKPTPDITHAGLRLWGTGHRIAEWHRQDPRLAIIARNLEHP